MEGFSGNYTGPYWSDGKFQTSVEFGGSTPQSELDKLSRLHDSAYAHWPDRAHREAADEIYNEQAHKLASQFPELAGNLVLYGNYGARQAKQLASDFTSYGGLPGLIKFGVTNLYNANKMVNGTYLSKEKSDVSAFYNTDPKKGDSAFQSKPSAKKITPFAEAQENARREARATVPTSNSSTSKAILDAGKTLKNAVVSAYNKVSKPNKVVPETKSERAHRLVEAQAKRFEAYNQVYVNSLAPPKRKRKIKKRGHGMGHALDTPLFTR